MVNSPEEIIERLLYQVDETDNQLDIFLDDLNSPETPSYINSIWITSRLPDISPSRLRDWIRAGVISPELGPPGRGRYRVFTQEEAKMIGHIWYFRKKRSPLGKTVVKAHKSMKEEWK